MKKLYISALMAASACLTGTAQGLSTEVVVDRSIDARLPEATMPQGIVPESPWKDITPRLPRRSEYSLWADFEPYTGRSGGADYTGLTPADTLPGYFSLGYFPAYNIMAQAGYSHSFNKRTRVGGALMFNGYNYHNHDDDSRQSVRDNTFAIVMRGEHIHTSRAISSFLLNYSHSALKNPSYTGISQSQGISTLMAGACTEKTGHGIGYKASVSFRYTGLDKDVLVPDINSLGTRALDPASENMLRFEGRVSYSIGHSIFAALNADATMLDNSGYTLDDEQFASRQKKTRAIIGARPTVDFRYGNVDLHLGMRVDWSLNTPGSSIHLSPDVSANWRLMPKLSLYGSATGGQRFHTIHDQMEMSIFAPGYQVFTPTFSPIDARVGLRAGTFAGLWADLHGGYSSVRDMPMPVLSARAGTAFVPVSLSGWHAGAGIGYSSSQFKAGIDAKVYPHSYGGGSADCTDRAKYVIDGKLTYRPHKKTDIDLNYTLRSGRRYYYLSPLSSPKAIGMGNISDLNLKICYRYTNRLSIFCHVNNILCRRAYVLPHLTSEGMHGYVGATLQF